MTGRLEVQGHNPNLELNWQSEIASFLDVLHFSVVTVLNSILRGIQREPSSCRSSKYEG
jgi:hypothetical protein